MTAFNRDTNAIVVANREKDLYFVNTDGRIIFIPQDWCDEFDDEFDDDDGPSIYGWVGNKNFNNWLKYDTREWHTDECQGWTAIAKLEQMRQVTKAEARKIDPDVFRLLDAIRSGEAEQHC